MDSSFVVGVCVVTALVALFVLHLMNQNKKYSVLMSPENISELSSCLDQLKKRVVAEIPEDILPEELLFDDLRATTSRGMHVIYTIDKRDKVFCHHISLSFEGEYFAHSAGLTMASWTAYFLNIPTEQMAVPLNDNGAVRHILFNLNDEEQRYFLASAVRVVSEEQVQALWKSIMENRRNLIRMPQVHIDHGKDKLN